ncbi:uncharacterized protein [Magallana gigas]|uniref:uncharacterized protein isoform X1 n=1 Tax=Magallana gigas TaxID=29159 RepID=UPI003341C7E4
MATAGMAVLTGLSCSIVLPTLTLPSTVFTGEECGGTTIMWTRGDFSDLDSRIILDSYQIDYKKTSEIKWFAHKELIKYNDSVDQYSWVISNLADGAEILFHVRIRVSEYGETLPEYTLGPISDPVIIHCNEFTAKNTSSYTGEAASYTTAGPFLTSTTATEQKPTESQYINDNTTPNDYNSI